MWDIDLGPDLRLGYAEDSEDYAVLRHVISEIGRNEAGGWGLEFGVATGTTLAMIARRIPAIGFDSFEGLPEDWRENFDKGAFKGVRPSSHIPNTQIVEGWFADTVPDYPFPEEIALVHIDCDLYSSTKVVLDSLVGSIHPGTFMVFDEFFGYDGSEQHEEKAFREWVDEYEIRYHVIGHGREQWAIRVMDA